MHNPNEQFQVKVIAVTGGKGGVGKTCVAANLGLTLASMGRAVMLMDADLGLANLDVVLGLRCRRTLADVLDGHCELADIVVTGPQGMQVVPGASGIGRMSMLNDRELAGLINAFNDLTGRLDYLIVDTAAGISSSVTRFSRAAQRVLVVLSNEPASLTDAYALIKVLSREHGVQQDVHARRGVVELGVLGLVVRDAVAARGEDHRGGRDPGDVVRVVPGLAQDVPVGDAPLPGRVPDQPDAAGIEALAPEVPLPRDGHLHVRAPRALGHRRLHLRPHPIGDRAIRVAHVAGDLRVLGEDTRLVGPGHQAGHRGLAFGGVVLPADLVDRDREHRRAHPGLRTQPRL